MGEKYCKDFLIKEIALRAGFTQGDVRVLLSTFEEIIREAVENHDEILIGSLFKIYVHKICPHTGFSLKTRKNYDRNITYRLTIKPSTTLKKILKNSKPNVEE